MIKLDLGIVYTIINLLVLYFLLRHFLIGPVTQIMEKRKQMIEDGFKNAQKAQDAMNAAKNEAFAKFEEAHKEDIEQALADLQARKQALIDANEAS